MMRKLSLILIGVLFATWAYSQSWFSCSEKSSNEGFFQQVKQFNDFWDDYSVKNGFYYDQAGTKQKAYGYKQFKRREAYWAPRVNRDGTFPLQDYRNIYLQQLSRINSYKSNSDYTSGVWTPMGPDYCEEGIGAGIGRINAIAFDLFDDQIIYAGTPAGGLWKTYDHGDNWIPLGQDWTSLGVSDIVIANLYGQQVIFVSTGDHDAQHSYSTGILKSTDGGEHWETTGLSFTTDENVLIYDFLINPLNNMHMTAITNEGKQYTSFDGGANWAATEVWLYD